MQKEYVYVIISGILSGIIIFGGKLFSNLGLSLFELSILSPLIWSLILLPFVIFFFKIKKGMLPLLISYGLISSLVIISQYSPVFLGVPVSLTVLLLYTQPLWTIIISKIFLKEKITLLKIISMILVLLGVVIMVNPFTMNSIGSILGVIIAAFGGFFLSLWVIASRIAGERKYHPIAIKFCVGLFSWIFLFLFFPLLRIIFHGADQMRFNPHLSILLWLFLIFFVALSEIINHMLYYKAMQKVPASDAGIMLLLEPLSASILAWVFLSEAITIPIIIGGILIILGNYFVVRSSSK